MVDDLDEIERNLEEFHRRLSALCSISRDDLESDGAIDGTEGAWQAFRSSPWAWFLSADDERKSIVWGLIGDMLQNHSRYNQTPPKPDCDVCQDGLFMPVDKLDDNGCCIECGFDPIPF